MGRAKTFGVGREYDYPLNQLLVMGRPSGETEDTGFVDRLGITVAHAPQLIRMATDPDLTEAFDFPAVYAWRALARFRYEPAVLPLIELLRRQKWNPKEWGFEEWVWEELPDVFALLGPASGAPLADLLSDTTVDHWSRVAAIDALAKIAKLHPSQKAGIADILGSELAKFRGESEDDGMLNASLARALGKLESSKWLPTIRSAHEKQLIDETHSGDWDDFVKKFNPEAWPKDCPNGAGSGDEAMPRNLAPPATSHH